MLNFFTILGLIGVTNIITRSYLLQGLRDALPFAKLRYMAACPMCTGFWIGVLFWIITHKYVVTEFRMPESIKYINLMDIFVYGGAVSVGSSFVVGLLDYISFGKSALIAQIENSTPISKDENND